MCFNRIPSHRYLNCSSADLSPLAFPVTDSSWPEYCPWQLEGSQEVSGEDPRTCERWDDLGESGTFLDLCASAESFGDLSSQHPLCLPREASGQQGFW